MQKHLNLCLGINQPISESRINVEQFHDFGINIYDNKNQILWQVKIENILQHQSRNIIKKVSINTTREAVI